MPLHPSALEILNGASRLGHLLRARVAKYLRAAVLQVVREEGVPDVVSRLADEQDVGLRRRRPRGRRSLYADLVPEQSQEYAPRRWILRMPLHPGPLEILDGHPVLDDRFRARV